jgi:hypothetical protein
MAPSQREERNARNESLFREVNERISEVNPAFEVGGLIEFLCECGREACLETVSMTRDDYQRTRSDGDRFAVKPGHEDPTLERVLERHPDFVIVEKVGEAGKEAEERDPR